MTMTGEDNRAMLEAIKALEREWDPDEGFFGQLREGTYSEEGLERVVAVLSRLNLEDEAYINRRLVSLVWFMPLFMHWQRRRVEAHGGNMPELDRAISTVEALLLEMLGVP